MNTALLAASSRAFSVNWSWAYRWFVCAWGRAVCILFGFRVRWFYLLPLQFVHKGIPSTHGLQFSFLLLILRRSRFGWAMGHLTATSSGIYASGSMDSAPLLLCLILLLIHRQSYGQCSQFGKDNTKGARLELGSQAQGELEYAGLATPLQNR